MTYPTPSKDVDAAMRAKSHLNIFAAIAAILECGTIYGDNSAKSKIIKICHAEQQRQLKLMDKAVDAVNKRAAQLDGSQEEGKDCEANLP